MQNIFRIFILIVVSNLYAQSDLNYLVSQSLEIMPIRVLSHEDNEYVTNVVFRVDGRQIIDTNDVLTMAAIGNAQVYFYPHFKLENFGEKVSKIPIIVEDRQTKSKNQTPVKLVVLDTLKGTYTLTSNLFLEELDSFLNRKEFENEQEVEEFINDLLNVSDENIRKSISSPSLAESFIKNFREPLSYLYSGGYNREPRQNQGDMYYTLNDEIVLKLGKTYKTSRDGLDMQVHNAISFVHKNGPQIFQEILPVYNFIDDEFIKLSPSFFDNIENEGKLGVLPFFFHHKGKRSLFVINKIKNEFLIYHDISHVPMYSGGDRYESIKSLDETTFNDNTEIFLWIDAFVYFNRLEADFNGKITNNGVLKFNPEYESGHKKVIDVLVKRKPNVDEWAKELYKESSKSDKITVNYAAREHRKLWKSFIKSTTTEPEAKGEDASRFDIESISQYDYKRFNKYFSSLSLEEFFSIYLLDPLVMTNIIFRTDLSPEKTDEFLNKAIDTKHRLLKDTQLFMLLLLKSTQNIAAGKEKLAKFNYYIRPFLKIDEAELFKQVSQNMLVQFYQFLKQQLKAQSDEFNALILSFDSKEIVIDQLAEIQEKIKNKNKSCMDGFGSF